MMQGVRTALCQADDPIIQYGLSLRRVLAVLRSQKWKFQHTDSFHFDVYLLLSELSSNWQHFAPAVYFRHINNLQMLGLNKCVLFELLGIHYSNFLRRGHCVKQRLVYEM